MLALSKGSDVSNWSEEDFWTHWIETKDVLSICIYEFDLKPNEYPTPTQCKIIRKVLFDGCKRLLLNCHTRFGKSHAMGMLANLYIIFNKDKKVNIIGPSWSQTYIIRKVAAKFLSRSRTLKTIAHFSTRSEEGDAEASKKRQTFSNGCEIATIGVNGKGEGAMGEGGDLNIVDEMALIDNTTFYEKVFRMLGDNPETSIMVGLFNPWGTDNVAADLWNNPRWENIHVDWRQGIIEGRITQEYVDEQKESLTPIQFEVLFESKFPKTSVDTILTADQVQIMFDKEVSIKGNPFIEIGVDVARFGKDQTVIACRRAYKLFHIEKHGKEDTMQTSGRVAELALGFNKQGFEVKISIDDTGLGGGVTDRLNEEYGDEFEIIPVINGSTKTMNEMYYNKITELWMWFRENYELLDLPEDADIMNELTKRKYKLKSNGKQLILESKDEMKKRIGKSPDTMDAIANAFASETTDLYDQPIGGFI